MSLNRAFLSARPTFLFRCFAASPFEPLSHDEQEAKEFYSRVMNSIKGNSSDEISQLEYLAFLRNKYVLERDPDQQANILI